MTSAHRQRSNLNAGWKPNEWSYTNWNNSEKRVKTSHRLLNDLRTLRRLLLKERAGRAEEAPTTDVSEGEIHELDGACQMARPRLGLLGRKE